MRTTIIGPLVAVLLATGCASADQKMASKRNYRESQVAAIAVQETGRVDRAHAEALEQQAMWKALAEVVKANPEAASHVAPLSLGSGQACGRTPRRRRGRGQTRGWA